MNKQVVTALNYKPKQGEVNTDESLVEDAGYIPKHIMINQMQAAGMALDNYYAELFDGQTPEEISDRYYNPISDPEYDMIDAANDWIELELKLKREAMIKKKEEETEPVVEAEPVKVDVNEDGEKVE